MDKIDKYKLKDRRLFESQYHNRLYKLIGSKLKNSHQDNKLPNLMLNKNRSRSLQIDLKSIQYFKKSVDSDSQMISSFYSTLQKKQGVVRDSVIRKKL